MSENPTLTRKDFSSDQEVRWCPGCGDYAILATMQRTLPGLGARPENTVFVSGIGCAARFPYYMKTYGFHTIHGRGPAVATGLKLARPELDVWLISGDGDALSIGGNHILHVLRRNVDIHILLFNNRIYGLTKGQYSPTSLLGTKSPSTPFGSVDPPVAPVPYALGSGASFVARAIDTQAKTLGPVMEAAYRHRGASFVEILQNCPIFNDGAWSTVSDRKTGSANQLWVEHGKPLRFGANMEKGIRLRPGTLSLEAVTVGEGGVGESDLLVHDETDKTLAFLLAGMLPPALPMAFGVIHRTERPTYDRAVREQNARALAEWGPGRLNDLLRSGHTWTVE